jgi:hypothetical protein
MKTSISEINFISLVTFTLVVLFSLVSCNSVRNNHGLKNSDFNPDHKEEALDILDYVELEQYLNSL